MTPLTIIPITAATPGKRECATCRGMRMVPPADLVARTAPACPACNGRGHTVTHDLTAKDGYFHYGYDGGDANGLEKYESVLRRQCRDVDSGDAYDNHDYWAISTVDALDAIQPGDTLAHDGTELGRRCAEVVARLVMERVKG